MRAGCLSILIALSLVTISVQSSWAAEDAGQSPIPGKVDQPDSPPAKVQPGEIAPPASVTIIEAVDAHGIMGREVRSAANENMGRIVDVIVDRIGQVRAAVIDFGGFLGVGSRRIVVDWSALRFARVANKSDSVSLELTKDQVKAAPEYKEDKPIVVLGASGNLEPLRFNAPSIPEK